MTVYSTEMLCNKMEAYLASRLHVAMSQTLVQPSYDAVMTRRGSLGWHSRMCTAPVWPTRRAL